MLRVLRAAWLCFIATLLLARVDEAHAEQDLEKLTGSYFYDGGAIPFIYGATAGMLTLEFFGDTRRTPLWFSDGEGGEQKESSEVNSLMLVSGAAFATAGVFLIPDESRLFHIKGAVQSLAMTSFLTTLAKRTFGRHRPTYRPGSTSDSDRQSFFSGHSSVTLAATTYLALQLRFHGFDESRGDRWISPWEAISYLGLAAIATYVPYTRVRDKHHHLTDVIAGGATGALTSIAFFAWQESRYRRARKQRASAPHKSSRFSLIPVLQPNGIGLSGTF